MGDVVKSAFKTPAEISKREVLTRGIFSKVLNLIKLRKSSRIMGSKERFTISLSRTEEIHYDLVQSTFPKGGWEVCCAHEFVKEECLVVYGKVLIAYLANGEFYYRLLKEEEKFEINLNTPYRIYFFPNEDESVEAPLLFVSRKGQCTRDNTRDFTEQCLILSQKIEENKIMMHSEFGVH